MKIMARHSNVTPSESTPRKQTSTNQPSATISQTPIAIDAPLKRRARLLITNSSIPKQTRSLILYALKIKDPDLAQVVSRVESGEMTIDCL